MEGKISQPNQNKNQIYRRNKGILHARGAPGRCQRRLLQWRSRPWWPRWLSLDVGDGLGQWEEKIWPDLFIAKPGVYWSPTDLEKSVKSRGAPRSIIGRAAPQFRTVFAEWLEILRRPDARNRLLDERLIPSVPITVRVFNGCRLALAHGKPWLAGKWEDVTRHESFEWNTKRDPTRIGVSEEGYVVTFPPTLSSISLKAKATNQRISID